MELEAILAVVQEVQVREAVDLVDQRERQDHQRR